MTGKHEWIAVLDFGSQYTQLIARRVRESGVFSEILPYDADLASMKSPELKGIILSGGPSSVYDDGAPRLSHDICRTGSPFWGSAMECT